MSNTDADTHTDTITYAVRFLLLIMCKRLLELYSRSDTIFCIDIYLLLSCMYVSLPLSASPNICIFTPGYLSSATFIGNKLMSREFPHVDKNYVTYYRKCRI